MGSCQFGAQTTLGMGVFCTVYSYSVINGSGAEELKEQKERKSLHYINVRGICHQIMGVKPCILYN
jgi:hypothetical protein